MVQFEDFKRNTFSVIERKFSTVTNSPERVCENRVGGKTADFTGASYISRSFVRLTLRDLREKGELL